MGWLDWTGLGMALQVYKVALVLMRDSFAAFVAFVACLEDRPLRTCFCRLPFLVVLVVLLATLDMLFAFCFWLLYSFGILTMDERRLIYRIV